MVKAYTPPSLNVSPNLYVGIIKAYDKIRKFGYIMVLYKRDVFFHIKGSNILNPESNTFVAFKIRKSPISGKIEAYELNTITYYMNELLTHQENLLTSDVNIVYYHHPELIEQELYKRLKEEYGLLDNIDKYIDNYNISDVIDSYSVEVVSGHIYKPGDDDVAMVNYSGDRKKGIYLITSWSKWLRDTYVDTILPPYHENIFHDRGFCPWEQMLEGFGDLTLYRQEAIKKTIEVKERAVKEYNKQMHKDVIVKFLKEKIANESMQFQRDIERSINNSLIYGYKLDCSLKGIKF